MKRLNCKVLQITNAGTGTQNGPKIDSNQLYTASFHCLFGDGAAAGTIKIQASNDICPDGYQPDTFTPTNWVDTGQSAVVATGAAKLLVLNPVSYRWLRMVWTGTGGAGSVIVNMFAVAV